MNLHWACPRTKGQTSIKELEGDTVLTALEKLSWTLQPVSSQIC